MSALHFDPATAAQLACPVCFGNFSVSADKLICRSCGRAYPIVDGIPVLIAERADVPAGQEKPAQEKQAQGKPA